MDTIAYIIDESFIYWNSIILALAVCAAICVFLFLFLREKNNGISAALFVPLAMVTSIFASRAIHWYCRADAYEGLKAALTGFTGGGYALMGVFAACAVTALVLRLLRIMKNLPFTFDCMALAGGVGIAVGRLACLYNTQDRGPVINSIRSLPLVYPVTNAVTGVVEWRFATFMIQAIATGLITAALLVFYLRRRDRHHKLRDGDTACLWLCAYGASQVVLDSTRYDSLFMRSNGFISIVQILGAAALVLAIVLFSVRMVKHRGLKWYQFLIWPVMLALLGGAGYMEYHVQRHGDQAVFAYSVMSACIVAEVVLILLVRCIGTAKRAGTAAAES